MSFKNEVVSIGTTDTDIHEMGAGLEGAVVLGVGNTTASPITYTIKFYKQSLGTTTTIVSGKSHAANDLQKVPVPIAMEAGDKIIMSAASAGLRAFATVTDSSSIGSGGAWNPRGEYSAVATYAKRDVVYVAADGVSYISLQDDNTGNTPSSQPSFWMVNADKGDPGELTQTEADALYVPLDGGNLAAGFTATSYSAGTKSSGTFTPDPLLGTIQHATNNGAHTLAPPTSPCTMVIEYTNGASAGTVTTSGFTRVTGDPLTTTDTNKFVMFIVKTNSYSALDVVALQ